MIKFDTKVITNILRILILITAALFFARRAWVGEDAFIFFRYVDNLLDGHGLVFNVGERVEGFTAPLWVFTLAATKTITSTNYRAIAIMLGLALSTISIALLLFFDNENKVFFPAGTILLFTNSAFRDFATSGFETSLTYLLLIILSLQIIKGWHTNKPALTSFVLSLLVLNRPEAFLFFPYLLLIVTLSSIKKDKNVFSNVVAFLLPFLLIVGGYQVFRMGYFASLLPNTFYAKKGGSFYLEQGTKYIWDFVASYWFSFSILMPGFFLSLKDWYPPKLSRLITNNRFHLLVMSVLSLLYILYAGGDYMHGRSILISFILMCVFVNKYLEKWVGDFAQKQGSKLTVVYSVVVIGIVNLILLSQAQKPITVIATTQIRGIKDERFHFGFDHKLSDFSDNLDTKITYQFGWAERGWYYKEVAEALDMPISVVMGNIGFFGQAAQDNINVMGCSLSDSYLARYPIQFRGTIGHEGDPHHEYVLSRKPNFAYTPFPVWNKALQFKYEKAEHSYIITGDGNGSLIPVFDLSDSKFLDAYSTLVGKNIKTLADNSIREYLHAITPASVKDDFGGFVEFMGFLNLFWKPYSSDYDKGLFDQKRQLIDSSVLSSYEFFDKTLKEKSDEMMHRISAPLTPALFKQNITYAINNGPSKTNNIPQIVKIGTQNDLAQDNIEYENIVYDYDYKLFYVPPGPSLGYVKMTTPRLKRRGFSIDLKRKNLYPRSKDRGLTLRSINTSDIKNNHYLKLSYRIAKQANKLRVSYNDKDGTEVVIFEHIPEAYAESQDLIDIYLDVSDAINKSSHVKVVLERNVGPAAFEVGFRSIELY